MANYTNSVVRTLGDKLGELPSLRDYGAVGDGATDDTTAVQNAVTSVAARGGGKVLVDPGNYKLTAPVVMPDNVTIVGYGETSKFSPSGAVSGTGWFDITGTDCGLQDILIDCAVTTATKLLYAALSGDPIEAQLSDRTAVWVHGGAVRPSLQGVIFRHAAAYSVLVDAEDADITAGRILNCTFENNRPHFFGTASGDKYGAWTGGVLLRGDCRTITLKPYAVKGFEVSGCRFRRNSGNCLWMHSKGFDAHHTQIKFTNNSFEDCGLDAILLGNVEGAQVSGNIIHRVGYITETDSDTPVPKYLANAYAVGIDASGYVKGATIDGNTLTSVNGGFIDLDGVRDSIISNNTLRIPDAGTPQYTEDAIASYGLSGTVLTAGINTGNTQANGGGADLVIRGNNIRGCGAGAVRLNFAKRCFVGGNRITHAGTASEVPIQFYALQTSSGTNTWTGSEYWVYDNVVEANHITYDGANFAVAETGTPAAYGTASCTNLIFNNHLNGTCYGEFLASGSSSSRVGCTFSSNNSALTNGVATELTQVGSSTAGALQFYKVLGGTRTYLGQWAHTGAVLNIGGTSGTGAVALGTRVSAGTLGDFLFGGKLIADGFLMLGDASYNGTEADQFSPAYGFLKYVQGTGSSTGTGHFEYSVSTASGTRVWTPLTFGSSAPPGADKQVLFNDGGAYGAVPEFTYDKTTNLLQITANTTRTYGHQTFRVNFSNGASAFDVDWGGYISSTNASLIMKNLGGTGLICIDGNASDPGIRMDVDRSLLWGTAVYAGYFDIPTYDLGLNRAAGGVLQITNGTGSNYRDLRLRNLAAFGTAADTIQAPTGGVSALVLISTRTDGDSNLVLSRPAVRDWGLDIDGSGSLAVRDRTGTATRFVLQTNGQAVMPGLAGQASLTLSTGYLNSSEGFLSTNTAYNAFQASLGGGYFKWLTLDNAAYLKTLGTAVSPTNPGAGYGGVGHRTGSTYWYWNGSTWASVDFAASGATPPGSDTQLIFNDASAYGASAKFTVNKTTGLLTIAGTAGAAGLSVTGGYAQTDQGFYSAGTSATTVNIPNGGVTALSLISVRNDGGAQLTFARNSGTNTRQYGWKVSTAGQLVLTDDTAVSTRVTLTTAGAWQVSGDLSFGASSQFLQGTTTRLNSSGQFVGALFNATNTGASLCFQANGGNIQMDGSGNISAAGAINIIGAYKTSGATVINTSGAFVGAGVAVGTNGLGGAAFSYWNGSAYETGQTKTVDFTSYAGTLTFKGGVLVNYT